jgi:hypothetical protein
MFGLGSKHVNKSGASGPTSRKGRPHRHAPLALSEGASNSAPVTTDPLCPVESGPPGPGGGVRGDPELLDSC